MLIEHLFFPNFPGCKLECTFGGPNTQQSPSMLRSLPHLPERHRELCLNEKELKLRLDSPFLQRPRQKVNKDLMLYCRGLSETPKEKMRFDTAFESSLYAFDLLQLPMMIRCDDSSCQSDAQKRLKIMQMRALKIAAGQCCYNI